MNKFVLLNRNCPNCGKDIPDKNIKYCPFCGKALEEFEYIFKDDKGDILIRRDRKGSAKEVGYTFIVLGLCNLILIVSGIIFIIMGVIYLDYDNKNSSNDKEILYLNRKTNLVTLYDYKEEKYQVNLKDIIHVGYDKWSKQVILKIYYKDKKKRIDLGCADQHEVVAFKALLENYK